MRTKVLEGGRGGGGQILFWSMPWIWPKLGLPFNHPFFTSITFETLDKLLLTSHGDQNQIIKDLEGNGIGGLGRGRAWKGFCFEWVRIEMKNLQDGLGLITPSQYKGRLELNHESTLEQRSTQALTWVDSSLAKTYEPTPINLKSQLTVLPSLRGQLPITRSWLLGSGANSKGFDPKEKQLKYGSNGVQIKWNEIWVILDKGS